MDAIQVENLRKTFIVDNSEIVAIDNLSFSIEKGQIVGLLGPNGAGKTTTVRIIASLYKPTSGKAKVNDLDSQQQSLAIRSQIGIAHEKPSFYSRLSGRRNLRFYAELYDVSKETIHQRIDDLAKEFDLDDAIDQPVGGYSKGMKQKLSVAKALIHDPDILILDEPWSGLSPGATRDLRYKIQELGDAGKTILITTHNLAQAEQVVDQLVIISNGKLVAQGSPADLRSRYHLDPQVHITLENSISDISMSLPFITSVSKQKSLLAIGVKSFEYTPKLVKYLVDNDAAIHQVKENIPSLEEIYLELVEEEN